jgi:flagellar FliL protein
MFSRWRKTAPAAPAEEETGVDEVDDEAAPAPEKPATEAKPAVAGRRGGMLGLILSVAVVTLAAAGLGAGLGMRTASTIEKAVAERARAETPAAEPAQSAALDGDMVVQPVEAVVTNLAAPGDVWIRLETAVVFKKGAVENPAVMAAEIREDILAYARTVSLAELEGPSALQHLREDLNERVAIRTDGRVNDLVIQSLVVQ